MKLIGFRVKNFRSVEDSGWIETDGVTALIGTNESGKTNLLIPLWKLNPAKNGEINPIADYPRKKYHEFRSMEKKPQFIIAHFELTNELAEKIAEITGAEVEEVRVAEVSRDFSGKYYIGFPNSFSSRNVLKSTVSKAINHALVELKGIEVKTAEEEIRLVIIDTINTIFLDLSTKPDNLSQYTIKPILSNLESISLDKIAKRSPLLSSINRLVTEIKSIHEDLTRPLPSSNAEARTLVLSKIPSFVYYSNYGNLDSEIYLPHVIDNLNRTDLGQKEEAKARTLKVLFEFVNLKPSEIRELGKDHDKAEGEITPEQIAKIAEKKKERDILLHSASSSLTQKFRDWWKQGDYRFRFQADGDHFRIWVSDDKRPEDIELENRSTGLQWFLSFYLIFLVESEDSHEDSILLLDEPGSSLHPIAQRDLSAFFDNLSQTNQMLYTTHSPFLVDPDQLDRVKAVFIDEAGTTKVSPDLKAGENHRSHTQSIYPVYAALGLSVSDILLQGCLTVIVEGASDQVYLSGIKNYLIGENLISPKREIVFIPSSGTRAIKAVASIITGRNEKLPFVILDSDSEGVKLQRELTAGLYANQPKQILMIKDFTSMDDSETEDLFPVSFFSGIIDNYLRRVAKSYPDEDFSDVASGESPIVSQIETYATSHNIELIKPGWKVEVSRLVKARLLSRKDGIAESYLEIWKNLFELFESGE
jgi:predicted ATP-dependent endonuclease of OLD family